MIENDNNQYYTKECKRFAISPARVGVFAYLIIVVICGLAVYAEDTTLSTENFRSFAGLAVYIFAALFFIVAIFYYRKISLLALIPIIYWGVVHLNQYTTQGIGLISLLLMILFFTIPKEEVVILFSLYRRWLVIMAGFGILAYTAHMLSIPLPHELVDYYSARYYDTHYINYYLGYLFYQNGFARLCGLFNEPGYFGTIIALMLCADQLDFKKRENKILLVAGVLTFSAAFFLLILCYIIINNRRNLRVVIPVCTVAILWIFVIPNLHFSNATLNAQISKLSLFGNEGILNRRTTVSFMYLFNNWVRSNAIFLGMGSGYTSTMLIDDIAGSSSLLSILIDNGILGFLAMYGSLLCGALLAAHRNLQALSYVIIILINLLQRPGWYAPQFMVIIFGGIYYICWNTQNKTKDINSKLDKIPVKEGY